MTTWPTKPITIAEFNDLKKQGRIGNRQKGDKAKAEMLNMINTLLPGDMFCECEYKFHHERKWKFDYAIPELKIAIEYEGLMSEKSGHTTITGYSDNCEKYNMAVILGWKVLRYTALNWNNLREDLKKLI
jgi:hypothetical protein